MPKYIDNAQIRKLIKTQTIMQDTTITEIAHKLNTSQQNVSNTLVKKHITFDDIQRICDAMDCDLYLDIRPRSGDR